MVASSLGCFALACSKENPTTDPTLLWIIDVKAGERHVGVTLPSEPAGVPPLIGLDHRVFVLLETGIMAFEPDGRLAWNVSMNAAPVGATITKNGVLMVSAGSQVLQIEAGDQRAHLIGDDGIGAFDPPARPAGVWTVGERIVGAMVCADGTLLVGAGSSILAFDRSGKRSVLHDFGRERVLTAPVLDADGRLLVVTNAGVYALGRG